MDRDADYSAVQRAVAPLFGDEFPVASAETDIHWQRDDLGKPYIEWRGRVAAWAEENDMSAQYLHVSNSHDGTYHLILSAYHPQLAGVGIDLVHLPRLRGRDAAYLHRFAAHFMGPEELAAFTASSARDGDETLLRRVAAHFSLMEAASKACGTGLKIGGGMGRPTSLRKQSLGALAVLPQVELFCDASAQARWQTLGAARSEGFWECDGDYLVSAVLLWRA